MHGLQTAVKTRNMYNFGENRPGYFTMTTHSLTLPSSPNSFWLQTKFLLSPTHRTPLIWRPVTSSYFLKWNWSWKDAGSIPLRGSRPNRRECLTLWQKRISRKRSKNGGDGATGVFLREGTTSRVTAADRPCGEFYDFYSVSPENFESTLVNRCYSIKTLPFYLKQKYVSSGVSRGLAAKGTIHYDCPWRTFWM